MSKYEVVIIVNPRLEVEQRNGLVGNIALELSEIGKVEQVKELGIKKLAYDANYKFKEGEYIAYLISSNEKSCKYNLVRYLNTIPELINFVVEKTTIKRKAIIQNKKGEREYA